MVKVLSHWYRPGTKLLPRAWDTAEWTGTDNLLSRNRCSGGVAQTERSAHRVGSALGDGTTLLIAKLITVCAAQRPLGF